MDNTEQTFVLEFKTIVDLEGSYKKIREAWLLQNGIAKSYMQSNGIEFQEIGEYGFAIDIDTLPVDLVPQEVLDVVIKNDIVDSIYAELGIYTLENK